VEHTNLPEEPLSALHHLENYRSGFTDLGLWEPYVRAVYERHAGVPCELVRGTLPGSFPTFICDDRWVIKFFGRLFEGGESFEAELQASQIASFDPALLLARVVAAGRLFESPSEWPWPYIIFTYLPGVSIGEVYDQVSFEDKDLLARHIGAYTRRLHRLPLVGSHFPADWAPYASFLQAQRAACQANHAAWGALPAAWLDQLENYILPVNELVEEYLQPHLIHADLTRDHVLGTFQGGHWKTSGLIDFGDAMVGDLFYELVALHIDLFDCDKRLLKAFMVGYSFPSGYKRGFARRAMSLTLLFRFNVLEMVFERHPEARQTGSLEELGEWMWNVG
jgi:hygromycin-B 7''-O-kinase